MPRLSIWGSVGLDGKAWQAGLRDMETSAKQWAGSMKRMLAGAFTFTAITAGLRDAIDYGSRISDLATRFKVPAEELQKLDFAAKQTGTSLEEILIAMAAMERFRLGALQGKKEQLEIAKILGINKEDLERESTDLFLRITDIFKKTDFGASTEGLLQRIFSESGGRMATLIEEDIRRLMALSEEWGVIMDTSVINKLDKTSDGFEVVKAKGRLAFGNVATFLKNVATEATNISDFFFGGLGAGIGGFFGAKTDTFDIVERWRTAVGAVEGHTKEIAKRTGAIKDDVAATEKETRDVAAELAAALEAEETLKRRKVLEEQIAAVKRNRLSDTEKEVELQKLLWERYKELSTLEAGSVEELEMKLKIEQQITEMHQLRERINKERAAADKEERRSIAADSLAKIGGFIGGAAAFTKSVEQRQLEVLKRIATAVQGKLKIEDI